MVLINVKHISHFVEGKNYDLSEIHMICGKVIKAEITLDQFLMVTHKKK